jgi:serine/threonine protein kinase
MSKSPELSHIASLVASSKGLRDPHFEGGGTFKETYRVVDGEGHYQAFKVFHPDRCDKIRTDREIAAMQKCNSPRIGKLLSVGSIEGPDQKMYLYTLEEYLDGGTLSEKISVGGLELPTVMRYGSALLEAIEHLSNLRLVHRDIKPENIMFRRDDPGPVLIDLGIVRDLSASSATKSWQLTGPGTPYYSAPEQLNNEKPLISWRTDQFSLGVVLGICLTRNHPFQGKGMSMGDTVHAVQYRNRCVRDFVDEMRKLGCEFMVQMLNPWPIQRHSNIAILKSFFDARR